MRSTSTSILMPAGNVTAKVWHDVGTANKDTSRQTDTQTDRGRSGLSLQLFYGRIGLRDEFDLESICAARCYVCWWDSIDKRTQRELMQLLLLLPLPVAPKQRRPCQSVDNKTGNNDNDDNDEFYWDSSCRAVAQGTRADYIRIKRRSRLRAFVHARLQQLTKLACTEQKMALQYVSPNPCGLQPLPTPNSSTFQRFGLHKLFIGGHSSIRRWTFGLRCGILCIWAM